LSFRASSSTARNARVAAASRPRVRLAACPENRATRRIGTIGSPIPLCRWRLPRLCGFPPRIADVHCSKAIGVVLSSGLASPFECCPVEPGRCTAAHRQLSWTLRLYSTSGRREPPFGDVPRPLMLRLQGLITLVTPCSLARPRRTCFRPAALMRFAAKHQQAAVVRAFPPTVIRMPIRSAAPHDHRDRAATTAAGFRTRSPRLAATSRPRVFSPLSTQPLRALPLQGVSESALRATVRTLLPHAWAIRKKPQPGVSKFRLAPLLATSARRSLAGAHGIPHGVLHRYRPQHSIPRRRLLCVHRQECRALPPTNLPASRRPHDLLTLSRPA